MANNEKEMISVIMPVYNAENTVGKTISSILCQSFQNFELIIVDDGSTDGTSRTCAQFDSEKIICLRQENAGPAAARNYGLTRARGSLICFVDADDTVEEDYLQVLADSIGDAGLAVCGYRQVTDSTEIFPSSSGEASSEEASSKEASPEGASSEKASSEGASSKEASPEGASSEEASSKEASSEDTSSKEASSGQDSSEEPSAGTLTLEKADAVMKKILYDDTIGGFLWNKIFRKSLLEQNGITFSRHIFVGEDLLFVEQYLACCRTVAVTDRKLYHYYCSENSISHAMTGKNLTILRALEKIRGLSDDPDFVKTVAVRYVRQFLSFAALFPDEECPPGRLASFMKNTGLSARDVFGGLNRNYKIKYVLYHTNRNLYRKIMSVKKPSGAD